MTASRASRKLRLDQTMVERGLAQTRAKAQALIMAGRVTSEGRRLEKPGARVAADLPIDVDPGRRWVGRGGTKLDAALRDFGLDVSGLVALDVGASTGGFTHVLLEAGARLVIAVDVGKGQLDWTLRRDPRVVAIEGINARYLSPDDLPAVPDIAVVDVSFISLRLVLPAIVGCLAADGDVVALVKPQFEVGRGRVGRGGIVRDPDLHLEVLRDRTADVVERGWGVAGVAASALPGAEGNVEFFVHVRPGGGGLAADVLDRILHETVRVSGEPRS